MPAPIDFLHQPGGVGIKVCGFREADNALDAIEAGADAVGLNFFPSSKRYVDPESVSSWVGQVRDRATLVGLFVNASTDEIRGHYDAGRFEVAQLHGHETPEDCSVLLGAGIPVIKAIGVHGEEALDGLDAYGTPYLLLDAHLPLTYGGSGETFDWELARLGVERYPDHRIVLAGGLEPDNVARAVAGVRPAGVDVASGVESAPGVKDAEAVLRFSVAARSASGPS